MTDHDDSELSDTAHRGPLVHFRGWLEYPESAAEIVGEILDSSFEAVRELGLSEPFARAVRKAWTVPELQIPQEERHIFWTYAFIGGHLHESCESLVHAQVSALAQVWEWNGPLKIWTTGIIQVEDDAGHWAKTWSVSHGRVDEAPSDVLP